MKNLKIPQNFEKSKISRKHPNITVVKIWLNSKNVEPIRFVNGLINVLKSNKPLQDKIVPTFIIIYSKWLKIFHSGEISFNPGFANIQAIL